MYILAFDIGGSKTKIGLVNDSGQVIVDLVLRSPINENPISYLIFLRIKAQEMLNKLNLDFNDLLALGVSVPGMFNFSQGILIKAPVVGWKNIEITKKFRIVFPELQVFVDNDANNCARAELHFGNTNSDFLWITVSTGIGSAVVLNKHVFFGSTYCAGEIGHIKVEYNHPEQCSCGQMGCLEAQASGNAIGRLFQKKLSKNKALSELAEQFVVSKDAKGCAQLAKQGDSTCLKIYHQAGDYIGRALASAVSILNCSQIFFGGGVAMDLPLLLPAIEKRLSSDLVKQNQNVEIKQTQLGYDASLLGAAALAITGLM